MGKVSIIIPVFKTAALLPKCIDSCINQTYHDIEIIIVIDGSPDNSYEIAKSFQEKDKRIKVISKQNEGLPKTRRVGFDASTGQYVFHLDSDDYIESNAIELLISDLLRENADIVVGGTIYEDKNGRFITEWVSKISGGLKTDYLNDIFNGSLQPNIWGRLIRREIFQPVFVPSQFNCGEDFLANIMMICNARDIKITIEPALLYHYLNYNESLTNTWPAELLMPYTDLIASILIKYNIEDAVMTNWAWFRVIKSWRYYLRCGGRVLLRDKNYINSFYNKYFQIIKNRLSSVEKFELILYKYNQPVAWTFSRVYLKYLKLTEKL